jgi:pimeloyl-ACP methyl ester carboxylesterase
VHLVGNSMGGHIALYVAASRPDLVRSLVLVDSTGVPFALTPGAHIENLVIPPGALSFASLLAHDLFRSGPASVLVSLTRLLRDDARPLMRTLRMPVLLVWGERDPLVPLTYARQIAEEIPQAKLLVIPRAGHVPMWENPAAFNGEVLAFLREVDSGEPEADASRAFSWGLSGWTGGIAHRQAGTRRDAVLVHGLGMSSAYFVRFARALFDRGLHPIAPDLPRFGESVDEDATSLEDDARRLAAWADAFSIRDALWIGHSLGANTVAKVAEIRPDLVHRAVSIGPLWSHARSERLFPLLFADAPREPVALWPFILREYWRCGLRRWFQTFARYRGDLLSTPNVAIVHVAGIRDPLPDRATLRGIIEVQGAHACHFSHPDETAEAVLGAMA